MEILYTTGDATQPGGTGPRIIAHVCNDIGGWGRGFVVALSRRWPQPEQHYRAWAAGNSGIPFALGEVQFVPVEDAVWVANMIGQRDTRTRDGIPPVRYDAIRSALQVVAAFADEQNASVHMPRIGAGLAGGSWDIISAIVHEELICRDIPVTVYDLPA